MAGDVAGQGRIQAPRSWPMVGRAEELRAIGSAVRNPQTSALVLTGDAGVGKSRLARAACDGLDRRRFRALRMGASPASRAIPGGAMAHLIPPVPTDAANLTAWAIGVLRKSIPEDGRLVVWVDDADLLDDMCVTALAGLVESSAAFLLLTTRSGRRLPRPLASLGAEQRTESIELGPLSLGTCRELLDSAVDAVVEAGSAGRLWQVTQGNPLYLRELVHAALDDGSLRCRHGIACWDGAVPMAPRLVDLIDSRVGDLPDDEAEALELVAFGEPLSHDVATRIVPAAAIEAVEAKGLLVLEPSGHHAGLRCAHPLYGEAVRAMCPRTRARRRLLQLAEATESLAEGSQPDNPVQLAVWRLDTDTAEDPDLLHEAATIAFAANDVPLAARLGSAALDAGGGSACAVTLSWILNYSDRPVEAEAALVVGEERAEDDSELARIAGARAYTLHYGLGESDRAMDLLARTERAVADENLRLSIRTQRGQLLSVSADCLGGLTLLGQVLEDPAASPAVRAEAGCASAASLGATGQGAAARQALDDVFASMPAWHDEVSMTYAKAVMIRFCVDALAGDFGEAELQLRSLHADATHNWHWDAAVAQMSMLLAQAARCRGRLLDARRRAGEAVALMRRRPNAAMGFAPPALGELAHALALTGESADAARVLSEADRVRSPSMGYFNYLIDLARPWVLACAGDRAQAVHHALLTAERARAGGLVAYEVLALHDAVRLGSAGAAAAPLRRAADAAEGDFAQLCAEHAGAVVAGDAATLAEVCHGFERRGMTLVAAEAAAQSATAYRTQQRAREASRMGTRARILASQCDGARTPALAELSTPGLTSRERQVTELAAAGMTSLEIAERLVVSVRTVDNHLHHAYAKLGVQRRSELAELLATRTV